VKSLILIAVAFSLTVALGLVGCSTCSGPNDYDYPTFGGKHIRSDRSFGRVGSILSDPITSLTGPSADSNLKAPPEPVVSAPDEDDLVEDLEDIDDADIDLGSGTKEAGSGTKDTGSGTKDSGSGTKDADNDLLNGDFESIEPELDIEKGKAEVDDSTASSRWRPRPLR